MSSKKGSLNKWCGLTISDTTSTIVPMRIIADTNTFLAVVLYEPERDEIIRLTLDHELFEPDVLPFEIGNALSSMLKRRRIGSNELIDIWDATQKIPVDLRSIDIRKALEIASQFNIYAYDARFLTCAISLRCPLITLDSRMNEVAKVLGIPIMEVCK